MKATAKIKYVRTSSTKLKPVLDLIRGKKVEDALILLKFTNKKTARIVSKVVRSAVANAEHIDDSKGEALEGLYISEIYANQGPTLKRFIPKARGRAGRILKRMSHIRVTLDTAE
ncbi:50S ribosomal protein L22 [bacterium]|nr:50S ribosomal protein L22 [bacterium]